MFWGAAGQTIPQKGRKGVFAAPDYKALYFELFRANEQAIRLLVEKGDMQGLYNDVKLTRFLEDQDVRTVLSQLDVDRVLGFVTEIRQTAPSGNEYIPEATPIEE